MKVGDDIHNEPGFQHVPESVGHLNLFYQFAGNSVIVSPNNCTNFFVVRGVQNEYTSQFHAQYFVITTIWSEQKAL